MRNSIKILCLCICMCFCLTACKDDSESKKIEENKQKIKENELRLQELEDDNNSENDNSEEISSEENSTTEEADESSEDADSNDSDDADADDTDDVDSIDTNDTETTEEESSNIEEGFIYQSDLESIVLKYISCSSDSLGDFISSYCMNDVDLLYSSECLDCSVNYSAREVSDNKEDYSYIVSFRAEYDSDNGSEFKTGILKVKLNNSKISNIQVLSFI